MFKIEQNEETSDPDFSFWGESEADVEGDEDPWKIECIYWWGLFGYLGYLQVRKSDWLGISLKDFKDGRKKIV